MSPKVIYPNREFIMPMLRVMEKPQTHATCSVKICLGNSVLKCTQTCSLA